MKTPEYEQYHEKKQHTTVDFPYNTYPCSIPLDFDQVPLHWHQEMEIIYIKKGCGSVSLDITSYPVCAGDIVFVVPGQIHGIYQAKDDEGNPTSMEYENIIFKLGMFSQMDATAKQWFDALEQGQIVFPQLIDKSAHIYDAVKECIDRADLLCDERSQAYQVGVKASILTMFYLLFANQPKESPKRDIKSLEKIRTIVSYVEEHYSEKIYIEDVAAEVGFSESHFMKFFKQTMNTSFVEYLNSYRLTMASRLLLSSDDSILEIAGACGYDNLSYFNRVFKKRFQMTPHQYRRM